MNSFIKHWVLFYFWIREFLKSKRIKGYEEISQNMLILILLTYIGLYYSFINGHI
jgi:hypothetical protein